MIVSGSLSSWGGDGSNGIIVVAIKINRDVLILSPLDFLFASLQ